MRHRVTAVIKRDNKILVLRRIRDGEKFYVLPGGGVEKEETIEEAMVREIFEETSLKASNIKKVWEFENNFNGNTQPFHIFLVKEFEGEPVLGGPEAKRNSEENHYQLEWLTVNEIENLNFVPTILKNWLIENYSS